MKTRNNDACFSSTCNLYIPTILIFPLLFHQERQQYEAYLRNNEASRDKARQNLD